MDRPYLEAEFGARLDELVAGVRSALAAADLHTTVDPIYDHDPAFRRIQIFRDRLAEESFARAIIAFQVNNGIELLARCYVCEEGCIRIFEGSAAAVPAWIDRLLDEARKTDLGKDFVAALSGHVPPPSPKHWRPARRTST